MVVTLGCITDAEEDVVPGEGADFLSEVESLLGRTWLHDKNVTLGLRKPVDLIGTADEELVRDLLRSLSVSALS